MATIGGGYNLDVGYRIAISVLGTDSNGNYGWHTISRGTTGSYYESFTNASLVVINNTNLPWDTVTTNALVLYDGTVVSRSNIYDQQGKLMYLKADCQLEADGA